MLCLFLLLTPLVTGRSKGCVFMLLEAAIDSSLHPYCPLSWEEKKNIWFWNWYGLRGARGFSFLVWNPSCMVLLSGEARHRSFSLWIRNRIFPRALCWDGGSRSHKAAFPDSSHFTSWRHPLAPNESHARRFTTQLIWSSWKMNGFD